MFIIIVINYTQIIVINPLLFFKVIINVGDLFHIPCYQRHLLGAVKKSKLCGTAPDYKGKMCGKVR